jgi:predicted nucleic acid-binding protein
VAKREEVKAVRQVLYDRGRLRKLHTEILSIDVEMNLNPTAKLDPNDIRGRAGSGPSWVIPATGEVDRGVTEAARRCQKVAALLRETSRDLADVSFPRADKRALRTALEEHAKAWSTRGRIWAAPGRPDADAAVAEITRHHAAAIRSYERVKPYLREVKLESLL